jgi:hypothetical protein
MRALQERILRAALRVGVLATDAPITIGEPELTTLVRNGERVTVAEALVSYPDGEDEVCGVVAVLT